MSQANFIEENLNNLGELDRHDFNYLSNNIKQFFKDSNNLILNEQSFNKLSHLFKIISYEDFPKDFDLTEVKIKYINGKICLVNKFKQICYEEDDKLYITPLLTKTDSETYYDMSKQIRNNLKNDKWKHKLYSKESYDKYDTYTSNNSCAVALQDAQIVSVLKANGIQHIKDIDLMLQTIELGGRLLESYREDFNKYVRYGFMPGSICKWEDERAPKEWIRMNRLPNDYTLWKTIPENIFKIKRQDIIFYIYTNHQLNINFDEWLDKVHYSESYEAAKAKQKYIWRRLNDT